MTDLLTMTDADFEKRISAAKGHQARIERLVREVFKEGIHFGPPGKDGEKSNLLAPGADEAFRFFGLTPDESVEQISGDGEATPHVAVIAKVDLLSSTGESVTMGYGGANNFEPIFLRKTFACPECGKNNIRRSNDKDEYYCWKKTGGCGETFEIARFDGAEPRFEVQEPWALQNALIKIGLKRARVDAALSLGLRAYFTQDQEADLQPKKDEELKPKKFGYALPDDGGSIPRAVAPAATADPVATYDAMERANPNDKVLPEEVKYSGDDTEDLILAVTLLAQRTGESVTEILRKHSEFQTDSGGKMSIRLQGGKLSTKSSAWIKKVLSSVKRALSKAGFAELAGEDAPF